MEDSGNFVKSYGRLLTGQELLSALNLPYRIFRPGSWEPAQVRSAGYDLRLAGDVLVIPPQAADESYRCVDRGDPEIGEFTLAPGDTALVSTVERFCLDLDITGHVSAKFRWAARGLLVLSGTAVHSGYGRMRAATGQWGPKNDERLYLVIANAGPSNVTLRRDDTIAYLQFFGTDSSGINPKERNYGFDYLKANFFQGDKHPSGAGLAYFRNVKDLQERVAADAAHHDQEMLELRREVAEAHEIVDRTQSATNAVVVFGVFLVAVTLLGIVVTSLTEIVMTIPENAGWVKTAVVSGLVLVYVAVSVLGVTMVALAVRGSIRSTGGARSKTAPNASSKT